MPNAFHELPIKIVQDCQWHIIDQWLACFYSQLCLPKQRPTVEKIGCRLTRARRLI